MHFEQGLTQKIGEVAGLEVSDLRAVQTADAMKTVTLRGARDKRFKKLAATITEGCNNDTCRISKILSYVRQKITFRYDPPVLYKGRIMDSEVLYRLSNQLDNIERQGFTYGDCDDFSTFTSALFLAAGMKAGFVAVETKLYPGQLDHIFCIVFNRDSRSWENADLASKRHDWRGHRYMKWELKPMSATFAAFPWESLFSTTGQTLSNLWGRFPGGASPTYPQAYPYQGPQYPPYPQPIFGGVDMTTLLVGGAIVLTLVLVVSRPAARYRY